MKKVYLVHGWGGSSQLGWFQWLKQDLTKKGFQVEVFDMPNTEKPTIESWVSYLNQHVKNPDKDSYFVGHSLGCQAILRFLETLPENVSVGGCAFAAGWFKVSNLSEEKKIIAKSWNETPINFEKVRKHCKKFLAVFSTNDPYVLPEQAEEFKRHLNAYILIKENREHFENVTRMLDVLAWLEM